jgi:hypothetical protein
VELEADPTTQRRAAFATARVLRDICLDTQVSKRPQFKDIEEQLSLLARVG